MSGEEILAYSQFPVPNASPQITTASAYINAVINTIPADKFDIRFDHNISASRGGRSAREPEARLL